MRFVLGLAAGFTILAVAAATSLSSAPTQDRPVSAPTVSVSRAQSTPVSSAKLPSGSNGIVRPAPVSGAPALSGGECEALGGVLRPQSVCASGLSCVTKDNNYRPHEVCISFSKK